MRYATCLRAAAVVVAVALLASSAVAAGAINLRWDALANASGYRVHYGTSPGSYSEVVDVGNVTQTTLSDLPDCTNYFVAVKAYNGSSQSAQFSNEVSGWARPTIGFSTPSTVRQGDQLTLDIPGTNFMPGAQVTYDIQGLPQDISGNDLVRVENVSVNSCSNIQALITVEPTARGERAMELGSFDLDVSVVNPDSVYGTRSATFTVQFGEPRADINRSDSVTTDRVDGKDLTWLAFAFGSSEGEPTHNPDADMNGDGMVDGDDLVFLAARFGLCWSGSAWNLSACP